MTWSPEPGQSVLHRQDDLKLPVYNQRVWLVVWPGFNPPISHSADNCLAKWANQGSGTCIYITYKTHFALFFSSAFSSFLLMWFQYFLYFCTLFNSCSNRSWWESLFFLVATYDTLIFLFILRPAYPHQTVYICIINSTSSNFFYYWQWCYKYLLKCGTLLPIKNPCQNSQKLPEFPPPPILTIWGLNLKKNQWNILRNFFWKWLSAGSPNAIIQNWHTV